MPIGATIFLGAWLLMFAALDLYMLITLSLPGDERKQLIVWKASAFTLLGITGTLILDVGENFLRSQPMTCNPLILLEAAATIFFFSLLYYRKKLGG